MIRATLRRGDGLGSGRIWLSSVVKNAQMGLVAAGHPTDTDGKFGSGTERSVKDFQIANGLPATGIIDKATWAILSDGLKDALGEQQQLIAKLLKSFQGDLEWVHEQEGHIGKPYWPKGQSGVTLDPGVDLGYAEPTLIEKLYRPLMSPAQYAAVEKVFGLRRETARNALAANPDLHTIRIREDQAESIMPYTAQPYWEGIAKRFRPLQNTDTLPSVQTVLLSLAYNRGVHNSYLEPLGRLLETQKWAEVANKVRGMQQGHKLKGIRVRRRREADLIRAELDYLQN